MTRLVLLVAHIGAGSLGLAVLPVIIAGPKGTLAHRRLGRTFLWCLRVVAASAVGLAALSFARLWWFVLVAGFSLALGEVGSRAWRRRRSFDVSVVRHLSGMGGAAIAFVTAVLVVNAGRVNVIAWVLPTIVGSPLIGIAIARTQRRGSSILRPRDARVEVTSALS